MSVRDAVDDIRRAKALFDIYEGNGCHDLFLTIDKAANEQPLHAYDDDHRRDHCQNGSRHDHRPIRDIITRREHLFDAHHDGVHFWISGDQQSGQRYWFQP